MRLIALLVASLSLLCAQEAPQTDRYPQVRALLREAEAAAVNIRILSDKSVPSSWAARLYAQAGYLDDAARAYGKESENIYLLRARVLYGDLAGAEKSLGLITDPGRKAGSLASLADLLWRMGEPERARIRFQEAKRIVPRIADVEHRKRLLASIDQGLKYLSEEPPFRVSAIPSPEKRFDAQDSVLPLFPITIDGFGDLDLDEIANRKRDQGEFMKKLYDRMAAGDRDGLLRLAESAKAPFQKAVGMASIEHIWIQAGQPDSAEQFAMKIPEVDSDCRLAKAEALSAAGAAWLRTGDSSRAHLDFEAAIKSVKSVPDLRLGKVSVVVSIAAAQFKGGMVDSSATTFRLATELARELPIRPEPSKAPAMRQSAGLHYQDEAYSKILLAAIRAHNLGLAREVAEVWRRAGGKPDAAIADAWLDAGQVDEATAVARKISNVPDRARALLSFAQSLLSRDGAPIF